MIIKFFILSIVELCILYYIFDRYSFLPGLIASWVYSIIIFIITRRFSIIAILINMIIKLIGAAILYKMYMKSNSFRQFLGFALLLEFAIIGAMAVAFIFLIFSVD